MCGIAGVVLAGPRSNIAAEDTTGHSNAAALELLEAAYCLQHRGQDACGIATADSYEHNVSRHTGLGLLTDVFKSSTGAKSLMNMKGELGIAHSTYYHRIRRK